MSTLSVDHLSIGFANSFANKEERITEVVHGISFEVKKGRTIGIVGESGSGKSVTSMSILRLLKEPPASLSGNHILFQSKDDENKVFDILKATDKQMQSIRGKHISMIFQEPMSSLNPVLTCGFQAMEPLLIHQKELSKKEAKAKTISLFEQVQLPNPERIFNAYPHQLSGGQKQRVMIAMALACNPQILIADEPTTALDVTVQKSILELLKSIQEAYEMSLIFITHDLGVIKDIADDLVVMYKGEIVESGIALDIINNPQHPYTKGLLACRPLTDRPLRRLFTVQDFLQNPDIFSAKIQEYSISQEHVESNRASIDAHPTILKVNNLSVHFKIKESNKLFNFNPTILKAVDDVSLSLKSGQVLGLVGESGCGKTTLGRAIIRLIEPNAGQVEFNNKNFLALNDAELRKERKHIQIIFQDPYSSLNPRMTIGDAISEPMMVHNLVKSKSVARDKTVQLLEKVGLDGDYYYRYPHQFSGGQRQRICIARALAVEPKVIICDESVSALDVSVQAQVLNLLSDLKDEFGLSYLFISHDLSVVKHISDRIIVMNKGKIEEEGLPEQIFNHPKSAYTQKLIDAIPGKVGSF